MSLKETLQNDLKDAMRQGHERRKAALRLTLANIRVAEVAKIGTLTDDELLTHLRQEVKRRRETVAELEKLGDRPETLADEQQELTIMEAYLPRQMSREDVAARVRAILAESPLPTGPSQVGEAMKRVMPQLKGLADGKLVQEIVREVLSA